MGIRMLSSLSRNQDSDNDDNEAESTDNEEDDEEYEPNDEDEELSEEDDPELEDSTSSPKEELSAEDIKKRTDELWTKFLKDVDDMKSKKGQTNEPSTTTKTVIKHYDFAGESIKVTQTISIPGSSKRKFCENGQGSPSSSVTSDSSSSNIDKPFIRKNGIAFLSGDPSKIGLSNGKRGMAGLKAVLDALMANKKEKIGTIEKTKLDWQQYKSKEGIEDELKVQLKSKDGYLDKQEFLQRTDIRQFEIERDLRTKKRRLK